jgi:hypothetical protein
MINPTANVKFTTTRQELADKYFHGLKEYAHGSMGLVSLLSDIQEVIGNSHGEQMWIINDIKAILIQDHKDGATCK